MKRVLTYLSAMAALTLAMLAAQVAPGAADGWAYHRPYKHPHAAYVEAVPDYGVCRVGWWQTVRYGHVRPQWAEYCR